MSGHPLDAPFPPWWALRGPQAAFALGGDAAVRFHPEVGPFGAVADPGDPAAWEELLTLAPGERVIVMAGADDGDDPVPWPPKGVRLEMSLPGYQMVGPAMAAGTADELVRLGPEDADEMLDLVAATRPGPFGRRTVELGAYLGVRCAGRLVAMAGERMHPEGHTEISAVCTAADHRGRGHGARLVRAVAAGILARREVPFLHVAGGNAGAIRLYEALGMEVRRTVKFCALAAP